MSKEDEKTLRDNQGPYPFNKIPVWCLMHPSDHLCAGGCWSILYDQVKENCPTCDLSRYYTNLDTN